MIKTAGGTGTNYVIRSGYGDYPLNSGDWTILISFKYPGTPTGRAIIAALFDGDADYTDPYIVLRSTVNTSDIFLQAFNGTTTVNSSTQVIVNGSQNWVAITYTVATTSLALIVNGVLIDTEILNLSTVVFDKLTLLGDVSANAVDDCSVAYLFAWSSVKTIPELTAQAASITPVTSTGLIFNNPLQASVDLTAHNNTLNQFNAIGTVTTDTTDPLLSVTVGPPTNTSPSNAITVNADTAYFQNTLTAGAATDVWFKRTCTESAIWGAIAFGDLVTYKPTIDVYQGLANAIADITYLNIFNNRNAPILFPAVAGNDYYFRALRNGAVTPATVIISILDALDLEVPIGSIAVNSEVEGFPLALLDANTGYPIHYVSPFPVGEGGNPLEDGVTLVVNIDDANCKLFNAALTSSISIALFGDLTTRTSSNEIDTFLVGITNGVTATMKLVAEDGTINPTNFDTLSTAFRAVGLNVTATIGYYSDNGTATGQPVKAWDLINNVALPDLVAGVVDYVIDKDIIVLQDGTILVARNKNTVTRNFKILRYNAAGALQSTYDLGDHANNDNRIATDVSIANFWAWTKGRTATGDDGFSIFNKIKVSDGSLLITTQPQPQYDSGAYTPSVIVNTPIRFGHYESCPFWITRVLLFPVAADASGLYILTGTGNVAAGDNPALTHDNLWVDSSVGTTENVAIPNPFGEGFLVGDE